MRITHIKFILAIVFAIPALFLFRAAPATGAPALITDPAAEYKAKCAMCHTPTASKFYDPAKPEEEHVQAILKGRKGEKPPFMPAFEAKGITEEGAKALVAHMKQLKGG